MMPYIGLMGEVEQQVVASFRDGGGVPYSAYPRFQALQAEETARVYDLALVDTIVPLVAGLTERLRDGIDVLDLGTGQGHAPVVLAQAFPHSRFHGLDQSEDGIAAARQEADRLLLHNVGFTTSDTTQITGQYDLITAFDVIHDLARPQETLNTIAASLREGGTFLMGDIAASSNLEDNLDHPFGPGLYGFSVFYCMTTSLSTGGAGLGTVWGEQTARRMLGEAGFTDVSGPLGRRRPDQRLLRRHDHTNLTPQEPLLSSGNAFTHAHEPYFAAGHQRPVGWRTPPWQASRQEHGQPRRDADPGQDERECRPPR